MYRYAVSLAQSGRTPEALAVCETVAPLYPDARALQVGLVLQAGDYEAAQRLLRKYIASSRGRIRQQLELLQGQLPALP